MDKFEEFLKSKTEKQSHPDQVLDKEAVIARFDDSIRRLFDDIEKYLRPYTGNGDIVTNVSRFDVTEEELGTYPSIQMTIKINQDIVRLTPIGAIILAAAGRIDMQGPRDKISLLLAKSGGPQINSSIRFSGEPEPEFPPPTPYDQLIWQFVILSPRRHYIPVTDDTFKQVLMKVIGG